MAQTYLGGKINASLNGITIPPELISDEGSTLTLTEGTREVPTMAGTFNEPSGTYDEAQLVFNIVLPSMNYLKAIFPSLYTASTDRPQVAGRTVVSGNTCSVRETTPVVIHYVCEPNSDNDIYIPNATVQQSFEITQNASDPVSVAITVNISPEEATGILAYLGTGSLDGETIWDPIAGEYKPLAAPESRTLKASASK